MVRSADFTGGQTLSRLATCVNRHDERLVMSYSGDEFVRLLMGAEIPGLLWSDTPLFFDDPPISRLA